MRFAASVSLCRLTLSRQLADATVIERNAGVKCAQSIMCARAMACNSAPLVRRWPTGLRDLLDANHAHRNVRWPKLSIPFIVRMDLANQRTASMRYSNLFSSPIWLAVTLLVAIGCVVPMQGALGQSSAVPQDDALAKSIVEKADRIRFPQEGFEVEIEVKARSGGEVVETRGYRVLSKGNENTIVMVTEPASERGQIMLMRERDLWVFLPSVSQPVRLSLSQRLTGQVANGDLARANFAGDYTPRVLRTEPIDGESYYVLELNAIDRSVTYHRVLYWVRQANFHPYKAEFYSLSDRHLKTARYENFRQLAGRIRPTRLILVDALRKGDESVLDYTGMKLRDLPDKLFTKDYLKRL